MELMDGIGSVPVIMGLFGLAEILENAEKQEEVFPLSEGTGAMNENQAQFILLVMVTT